MTSCPTDTQKEESRTLMKNMEFRPQLITLQKAAKNYVPKAIWAANIEKRLYAVEPERDGKIFVADGPTAAGHICTHCLACDVIRPTVLD